MKSAEHYARQVIVNTEPSAKRSSYQKLKAENRRMLQDIFHIIYHPDGLYGMTIIAKYRMRFDFEQTVLFGSRTSAEKSESQPFFFYELKEPGDYEYCVTDEMPDKPWHKRLLNRITVFFKPQSKSK